MSEQDRITALGKAITIRRVELGLSRNDLRDRSGLSYPYVAELEKGVKSPSSRSLEAIAEALEIRPHELLARAEALMLDPNVSTYDSFASESAPLAAASVPAPPSPASSRRWFGPTSTPAQKPTRSRSQAASKAPVPQPPLTEDRVREIVREELRRALGKSNP